MVMENTPEPQEVGETAVAPPVEDVGTLKTRLEQLEQELVQTKKGLSTAHQTLTSKDRELKRREDIESKIVGIEDRIELLATAIATQTEVGSEELDQMPKAKRQDVMAILSQKKQEQDAKRRQETLQTVVSSYQQRVQQLGLTDKDDSYWQVYDLVTSGDPMKLRRADIMLDKLEGSKMSPDTKPTESEEARIERLATEKVQKILKDRGLLIDETGGPSAVSASVSDATAAYARGDISETEARKRGVRF